MDLINYISNMKDIEVSCYKQRIYINQLKNEISTLRNPELKNYTELHSDKSIHSLFFDKFLAYSLVGFLIGAPTGIVFFLIDLIMKYSFDLMTIVKTCIVCTLGGAIIGLISGAQKVHHYKKNNKECLLENENKKIQNKKIIQNANKRISIL